MFPGLWVSYCGLAHSFTLNDLSVVSHIRAVFFGASKFVDSTLAFAASDQKHRRQLFGLVSDTTNFDNSLSLLLRCAYRFDVSKELDLKFIWECLLCGLRFFISSISQERELLFCDLFMICQHFSVDGGKLHSESILTLIWIDSLLNFFHVVDRFFNHSFLES